MYLTLSITSTMTMYMGGGHQKLALTEPIVFQIPRKFFDVFGIFRTVRNPMEFGHRGKLKLPFSPISNSIEFLNDRNPKSSKIFFEYFFFEIRLVRPGPPEIYKVTYIAAPLVRFKNILVQNLHQKTI
jgi:hypothetical protein